MVQANKWDTAPMVTGGFARQSFVNDNGATTNFMSDGAMVYNAAGAISNLPQKFTISEGGVAEMRQSAAEYHNQANQLRNSLSETWGAGSRSSNAFTSGTRNSFGTEGSSGTESGSNTTSYDRRGTSTTDGNSQSRQITTGVRGSDGAREVYSSNETMNASLSGGLEPLAGVVAEAPATAPVARGRSSERAPI